MNENFVKNKSSKQGRGRNKQSRFQKPKTRVDKSRFSQNTRDNSAEERKLVLAPESFPTNLTHSNSDTRPVNHYKTSYLANYFNSNVPKICKNSTYELFVNTIKNQELDTEVIIKFNNSNFFRQVHGYLIKSGHQENETMKHKLGPHTTPSDNNSWQFGQSHKQCSTFRNSSEVYSDLEMEIMSSTTNCQNLTNNTKNKKKIYLDEELFIELENRYEDLKGYQDLSQQDVEYSDSSFRPLNFSNGRVYLK
jgi:hypothetical protein